MVKGEYSVYVNLVHMHPVRPRLSKLDLLKITGARESPNFSADNSIDEDTN